MRKTWYHTWRLAIAITLVMAMVYGGLWARDAIWDQTIDVRFNGDINNGFAWGKRANREGYFSIYEREAERDFPRDEFAFASRPRLDYAPLRLGLMTWWTHWLENHEQYKERSLEQRYISREFHKPLLLVNTTMGLLAAVAAGILTFHLIRWRIPDPGPWSGVWSALIAAGATWFNPVVLYNAHAWPQWDIWPMPFFLFAVYLSLKRWWLPTGLLLGVGALLKGQMLMVAWIFPLWAILSGDWRGSLKIGIGMACAMTIIGLPWEISTAVRQDNPTVFDLWTRQFDLRSILFTTLLVGIAIFIPRRFSPTLLCLALAIGLGCGMWLFSGTDYWLRYSFAVGATHYLYLYVGTPPNLGALLSIGFGWERSDLDQIVMTLPAYTFPDWTAHKSGPIALGGDVSIRTFLLSIYFTLSTFCAVMAAIHRRRKDPRVILALILPWIMFFTFPAQVHERYLLYGSACCGMLIACGPGWFLMGLVITFIGLLPTVYIPMQVNGVAPGGYAMQPFEWERFASMFAGGNFPGIAWALLLAVAVCLVGLCGPRRDEVRP